MNLTEIIATLDDIVEKLDTVTTAGAQMWYDAGQMAMMSQAKVRIAQVRKEFAEEAEDLNEDRRDEDPFEFCGCDDD